MESQEHNNKDVIEIDGVQKNVDSLKYKDAQTLIQNMFKRIIQEKEVEGTSSYILSLENNSVKRQINEEKKNIDLLQLENEKINAQVIQTNEEFVRVQQNILNASEIDEQLKVYVASTKNKSIYIQESFREKFNKILDEKTAIESSINTKALYLEGLRKKINDFKSQCGSTDKKDENLLLKSECVDKREYSIKLKKLVENLKRNCETNIEILPLTTELAEKKEKIIELSNDINTTTVEKTKKINEVNENLVDITNRIDSTKERIAAINLKLTENSEIKKELQKKLEINQQALLKNEIEINKLEDEKIEKENKLFELSEQHTSKINVLKYDLYILENEVCTLKEENNNKVKAVSLNNFFAQYFEKMAEKDVLNDKKVALEKIQLLETEINTEKTNIKNAEIELEKITDNPLLVDLTKKKDFLDACKIYFSNQMENIKKQHSEVKHRVQEATGDVNRLTKSIEEKKTEKNRYRTLKRKHSKKDKINSTLVSVSSSTQDIEKDFNLPTSILKKKPQFTTPFSPKKVQFANLSSTESSGLTRTIEEIIAFKGIGGNEAICQLWGCASKNNIQVIQRFQNKVQRNIVDASWYCRNTDLHRDLKVENVENKIQKFASSHQRLLQHGNLEIIQLLNNANLIRRLKRTRPFELVQCYTLTVV